MYSLEIPAPQALIVGMAARDLNKVGNYEIIHVCWICSGAGIATPHSNVHIHVDAHTPTHIRTTQANIGIGTSRPRTHCPGTLSNANTPSRPSYQGASHHSKPQSAAEERPDPLSPSQDSWSPQDPGRLPHHPPKQPIPRPR